MDYEMLKKIDSVFNFTPVASGFDADERKVFWIWENLF